MITPVTVINELRSFSNPQKAESLKRYFKTNKGFYAENDVWWGLTVPQVREVAKKYKDLSVPDAIVLLKNQVHEVRLCALFILVSLYKKKPDLVFKSYIDHTAYVNNWDLVDCSAGKIVGPYCYEHGTEIMYVLARSKYMWERRIAMIATSYFIWKGDCRDALAIATILLPDKNDLIHKAVGWMLRDVGKKCSPEVLEKYLNVHASYMPRTALRYAIEHFSEDKRKHYLSLKSLSKKEAV